MAIAPASGTMASGVRIDHFVKRHLRTLDLAGRLVVDIPAGAGIMTRVLREQGARVEAYDLFPELFSLDGIQCLQADLSRELPIPSGHADLVLCQEAIEHVPNQLQMLRELSRILKLGGRLLLTTPNVSNLRARASHFLIESELYKRLPANELDAVWLAQRSGGEPYFGHLFLIPVQRLRVLARIAGFRIERILPVSWSAASLALGVLYPLLVLATALAYRGSRRRTDADPKRQREVFGEIARLNLHPRVLFGKKLFLELVKERDPSAMAEAIRDNRDRVLEHIARQKALEEQDRRREGRT